MTEDWNDARIARGRALEAIFHEQDFETQRSLWKAAGRYNERMREAEAATGCGLRPDRAWGSPLGGARALD